ncbi:MAG TPA: hypothetical protein VFP30_05065 [Candidatus Limnocylindria bacterium]|nr:hypothetical protein [Candidatus Limnocylindria bacterium]
MPKPMPDGPDLDEMIHLIADAFLRDDLMPLITSGRDRLAARRRTDESANEDRSE